MDGQSRARRAASCGAAGGECHGRALHNHAGDQGGHLRAGGVGLNIALGYGGLVSFGHAAFFGIGGYAMGILASHAQNYEPLMTWPLADRRHQVDADHLAGGDRCLGAGGAGDRMLSACARAASISS
jgi:hypothetical protein